MLNHRFTLSLMAVCLVAPTLSLGAPVSGTLNFTGDASAGQTFFNFLCTITAGQPCPANYGDFIATGLQSGDFTKYSNDTGYALNLNTTNSAINQTFSLSNWVYFNTPASGSNDVRLDLNFIFSGVYNPAGCIASPAAPGQTCTPALPALVSPTNPQGLSPFNFSNTQTGSTASFSFAGNAVRITTGESSPFKGVLTAQFTVPYQSYLPTILAGGTVSDSYSVTLAAQVVPEPTSAVLVLAGGLLLLVIKRRCFAR